MKIKQEPLKKGDRIRILSDVDMGHIRCIARAMNSL